MAAPSYYLLPTYDDENSDEGSSVAMSSKPTAVRILQAAASTAPEITDQVHHALDERLAAIPAHPAIESYCW